MRRYDAILLDVDGTLVDSNDAHAHAWVEALALEDIEVSWSRIRRLIGIGGDRMVELLAGHPRGSKENEKLGKKRGELFREKWLAKVTPIVGTRELILRLRSEGYRYAIASAARSDELGPLLEIANVADLCTVATTSSDVEESKPHPDFVEASLEKVPSERSRVVMLGDTPYDVEAARGASVDIIGTTTGGWTHEALAGAVAVFRGPADLLAHWDDSPLGPRWPAGI